MNLFIMSYEDVLNWYKPQTESEKYFLNLMRNYYEDTDDLIDKEKLQDQLDDAKTDIDNLTKELNESNDEVEELEIKIETLESDIEKLQKSSIIKEQHYQNLYEQY